MEKPQEQTTLEKLAALLVTPERFGKLAVAATVEIPANIELGTE